MLRALKVSNSDVGEGGVAVNCFLNTMYLNCHASSESGEPITLYKFFAEGFYIFLTVTIIKKNFLVDPVLCLSRTQEKS